MSLKQKYGNNKKNPVSRGGHALVIELFVALPQVLKYICCVKPKTIEYVETLVTPGSHRLQCEVQKQHRPILLLHMTHLQSAPGPPRFTTNMYPLF